MPGKIEMVGLKFGRLTVIRESHNTNGRYYWECVCDCGNKLSVIGSHLRNGNTRSCGCLQTDTVSLLKKTHGLSHTREHNSWLGMKQRCEYKNHYGYKYYGGRGISVCKRWRDSFQNFIDDMGKIPGEGYSLDRIDSNRDYSKENCRWATASEQSNNKRNNHVITFNGKTQTMKQWSRQVGINYDTIRNRLNTYGWTIERALTTNAYNK